MDADDAAPPEPADLVLGAEIAYRAQDATALAREIPARLRRGGVAVLCSAATRAPLRVAGELMAAQGLDVKDDVLRLTISPDGICTKIRRPLRLQCIGYWIAMESSLVP